MIVKELLGYEVREALGVKPKKVSYAYLKEQEGQVPVTELDNALSYVFCDSTIPFDIRQGSFRLHSFKAFAEDPNFYHILEQDTGVLKKEILQVMHDIKKIYQDEIIKHNLSPSEFVGEHMGRLIQILNTGLSAEEFYKRASILKESLEKEGKTKINEEDLYPELYEIKNQKKTDEAKFWKTFHDAELQRAESKEKRELTIEKNELVKQGYTTNHSITVLVGRLNECTVNSMKFSPSLEQCIQNPEMSNYFSAIRIGIKDYIKDGLRMDTEESLVKKTSVIFKNRLKSAYKNFVRTLETKSKVHQAIFDNIINQCAQTSGKKAMKFEISELDNSTIKEITSYYKMNEQARKLVFSLRERYTTSLVDMINKAYVDLIRTPGIQN